MKGIVSRIVAMVLVLIMALTAVACSGAGKKYATMEEYVASEEMQAELTSARDQLDDSMTIEAKADGNKLIYVYTYAQQLPVEGIAEQLKAGLDKQASVFESNVTLLKSKVNVEDPVLVIQYLNLDGSELYSQEFKAK